MDQSGKSRSDEYFCSDAASLTVYASIHGCGAFSDEFFIFIKLSKSYQDDACADDENRNPPEGADRFLEADLRHDNDEYVPQAHGWVGDREIEISECLKVQEDRNT
jgi:hypothetical protein